MGIADNNLKLDVIAEVKVKGRLLSDVAHQYGISAKAVYQWVRESDQQPQQREYALISEIAQLQKRIKQLNNELRTLG
ncbi:transposase [Shewanella sp. JNE10-2]|uniref:Transposase domain protein n=1 Tax=Shewanella putrefaciens (strain 200) TaxID=399804 RepID=E6XIT5_SHEP2|nr:MULTISPECIES: transposase [unclassified Shewanella]ABM26278.1 transposase IS3/IS911 family protein [Shewanella sp. W3-18-1]MCK7628917.1 transposase [Shewanella sp. JNE9-1]MCK7644166.1 transposase [Shewanella sp. JNE3-1]MCK7652195.1 transposase [Shewanella sp. JNE4-1]UPO28747.1 transposase [Shewanella sp. JNE10-2]